MARKSGLLMALALLVFLPASVSSLGLGEIRLNSYLNEPLDAEVTITTASVEELDSLKVAVASEEAFDRFGIERPLFLRDLSFDVETTANGGARLRIRSPDPVIEPFLTFLIEADWAGGRLLREYTVLLDPPLFLPEPKQPVQPEAPVADAPGAGVISRSPAAEPGPVVEPAPAPRAVVAPPAVVAPSTFGPVRRNDTLWRIASQVRPDRSVSVNQTMLALFEANPDAFEGNINVLREGATLTVPSRDEIARIGRARATAEVRRQHTEWEPGAAAGAPVPAPTVAASPAPTPAEERLELVVPGQPEAAVAAEPAPAAGPAATEAYLAEQQELNREMLSALQSLRQELEETRALIEMKDAEIAALQGRLGEIEAGVPAPGDVAVEAPVAALPAEATVEAPVEAPLEAPVEAVEPEPAAPVAAAPVAEPAPTGPEAAAPTVPVETPAPAPAAAPSESGGLLASLWIWIGAALVALLALALIRKRRQEQRAAEDDFAPFERPAKTDAEPVAVATGAAAAASFLVEEQAAPAARAAEAPAGDADPVSLEDTGTFDETGSLTDTGLDFDGGAATDVAAPAAGEQTASEYQYPFEDTIAGASGIDLDQSDPMAEADFHMAYGLYDQAADLIGKSVAREPDRVDLRMKLLDILFVWGKEDRFLTEASALRDTLGEDSAGDWGRVVIMGRQICPDEPLFEGETAADADVAVDATGGETETESASAAAESLDFDIGAEPVAESDEGLLDFDLGNTAEHPAPSAEGAADQTAELDIEDLGLDLDLGEATGEVLAGLAATGDEPEVDLNFDALQPDTGLNAQLEDEPAEGTAELPVPDAAELTSLTEQMEQVEEDAGELTEIVESVQDETQMAPFVAPTERLETIGEDDPTLGDLESAVAGNEAGTTRDMTSLTEILEATASIGDDAGTVVAQTIQMPAVPTPEEDNTDYTVQMDEAEFATQRLTAVIEQPDLDDDDTAQVEAVEEDHDPSLDLNDITAALGADLEDTAELPRAGEEPDSNTLMDEIFGDDEQTRIAPGIDVIAGDDHGGEREEPVQPAQVDVTLDEVGTKLDLARAYIDMGDPDGAKSILEEVLTEGDERQQDEARQLMDGVT